MIPGLYVIDGWKTQFWHAVIPWVGDHILQLNDPITVFPGGSGDTTYNYVEVLVFFVIAIISAMIWSVIDRKKRDYQRLNYWFIVIVRYYVASFMLSYGLSKVFLLQFGEPGFYQLLRPLGQMSPMGLAWTFIGFSPAYTIFSGLAEVIGGLLLLHRRTKYIGALIVIAVMTNVMALNYFYDVPVKLFSTQLWVMAVVIAWPKLKQLWYVLADVKATQPKTFFSPFIGTKWYKPSLVFKVLFVLYMIIAPGIRNYERFTASGEKPPMYGLYEVKTHTINGVEKPALLTDSERWRYIAMEYAGSAQVYGMDLKTTYYQTKVDTVAQTIALNRWNDTTNVHTLTYIKNEKGFLFKGDLEGKNIEVQTQYLTKKDFPIMSRGYHWIQEYPFNR